MAWNEEEEEEGAAAEENLLVCFESQEEIVESSEEEDWEEEEEAGEVEAFVAFVTIEFRRCCLGSAASCEAGSVLVVQGGSSWTSCSWQRTTNRDRANNRRSSMDCLRRVFRSNMASSSTSLYLSKRFKVS